MADLFLRNLIRAFTNGAQPKYALRAAKFGYFNGGTVAQITNKSTGVTLNALCGQITLNNANLANITPVTFTLTNNFIDLGDYVAVQHVSGGTVGPYFCNAIAAAGSANITVEQVSGGGLAEAIVLQFFVFGAATA